MDNNIITTYEEYLLTWTKNWALKIASRAGIEPGKGGRGKNQDPDRRLAESLGADYGAWQRYKAGKQTPNSSTFKVMHDAAIRMGLLGRGEGAEAELERLGPITPRFWAPGTWNELIERETRSIQLERNPELLEDMVANLKSQIRQQSRDVDKP